MGQLLLKICKYCFCSIIPDRSNSNNYTPKLYLYFLCINFLVLDTIIIAQEWININPTFDPPGNYNMSLGTFVDENIGWFTEGKIWRTTDGGITWKMQKDDSNVLVYDIAFVDNVRGWIVGKTTPDYTPFLWRTINGGKDWEEILTPKFYTLTFLDYYTGFAGGDSIYQTSDGGESWRASTSGMNPYPTSLSDIYFMDELNGWAVGESDLYNGIILNTSDGGETWQVSEYPVDINGESIYFTNYLDGYIVGGGYHWQYSTGLIWITNNGGNIWEDRSPTSPRLKDVAFSDDTTGWAVGDDGFIYYTEDGGETWEQVESGTNADLKRIVFVENGNVGYIFGKDNTLLRYDRTTDIKVDGAGNPSIFNLYQNYPNPFNPETKIRFSIPSIETREHVYVRLIVYDMLGKEVANLLNQNIPAGEHEVEFNADKYNLSSGAYIIVLNTSGTFLVRKVLLIK